MSQCDITICIAAYRCTDFLEDCIKSIQAQTYKDFKVLICFDNDLNSLSKYRSLNIQDDRFNVYYTKEHSYSFKIRNSLWKKADTKYVLFFDVDDIMYPNMLEELMSNPIEGITRYMFDFKYEIDNHKVGSASYAHGTFLTTRELYDITGGFEAWRCGADTEFGERTLRNNINVKYIDIPLFKRRVHSGSLTQSDTTGFKSEIRQEYSALIKGKRRNQGDIKINNNTIKLSPMSTMIHIVTPFSRWELKDRLTEEWGKHNIIWHPITLNEDFVTEEDWIQPLRVDTIPDNWDKCYYKLNCFIKQFPIIDEDYYLTFADDDNFEDNVIEEIRKMNNDVVVVSLKRGDNKVDNHGITTLYAEPEKMVRCRVSLQQLFYKGRVFKTLEYINWGTADGVMAEYVKANIKDVVYRRDLYNRFNHYQPYRYNDIPQPEKLKHIIISRVALKWRYVDLGMTWESWLSESIDLYNKYLRASLRNQMNQNFILCSLIDESVTDEQMQPLLPNEVLIRCKMNGEPVNEKDTDSTRKYKFDIPKLINEHFKGIEDKRIIVTRIDRDDIVARWFVDTIQALAHNIKGEKYIDIKEYYNYDSKHIRKKAYWDDTSPFVSTVEDIVDGNIKCYPCIGTHKAVKEMLSGIRDSRLDVMQIIHDHNISNRCVGEIVPFTDTQLVKFLKWFGIR